MAKLAAKLKAYMEFRAEQEGVGHTLNRAFYDDALHKGCRSFFGVEVNRKRDMILRDTQNPAAWNAFYRRTN